MATEKLDPCSEAMKNALMAMKSVNVRVAGTSFVGEDGGALAIMRAAKYGFNARRSVGYFRRGEAEPGVLEFEVPEAPRLKELGDQLVALIDLDKRNSRLDVFLDGKTALVMSDTHAHRFKLECEPIATMGDGAWIWIKDWQAKALGYAIKAATHDNTLAEFRMGVPDGDTLVIEVKSGVGAAGGYFSFRIEQPLVFGPWIDFREPMRAISHDIDVIFSPHMGSFNRSMAMVINRSEQCESSRLAVRVAFDAHEVTVTPLTSRQELDGSERRCLDEAGEPIPIKGTYLDAPRDGELTVYTDANWLRALARLAGDEVRIGVSKAKGAPLLVWGPNIKAAILAAKEE